MARSDRHVVILFYSSVCQRGDKFRMRPRGVDDNRGIDLLATGEGDACHARLSTSGKALVDTGDLHISPVRNFAGDRGSASAAACMFSTANVGSDMKPVLGI